MKETIFGVIIVLLMTLASFAGAYSGTNSQKDLTRDYSYEHYCDSIWVNDPDYYTDVLMETDKYIEYITKHGEWWN